MAKDFDLLDLLRPDRAVPMAKPEPMLSGDFDCVACGACCIEAGEVPVLPTDDVPAGLTASIEGVRAFAGVETDGGVRRMARSPGRRCAALAGQVGKSCACGIYGTRPAACRAFEAGSDGCLAAREVAEHRLRNPEARYWGYGDAAEIRRQRLEWTA